MPDEVTTANAVFFYITFTTKNSAQLMETREDHLAFVINEHKFADNSEKHISLQYLLPDIESTMLSGGHGIARTLILRTHIVWQKTSVLLVKLRGDKSHHLVYRKVGERALVEGEYKLRRITCLAELLCAVKRRLLTYRLLLELDHHDRNAVEEQSEIHTERLGLVLVDKLTADREHVLFVEGVSLGHLLHVALVKGEGEGGIGGIVLHLLIQRGEKTAAIYLFAEQLDKAIPIDRAVGRLQLIQFLGLRSLQELEQLGGVQRVGDIVIASLTLRVAVGEEIVKYLISERVFS